MVIVKNEPHFVVLLEVTATSIEQKLPVSDG